MRSHGTRRASPHASFAPARLAAPRSSTGTSPASSASPGGGQAPAQLSRAPSSVTVEPLNARPTARPPPPPPRPAPKRTPLLANLRPPPPVPPPHRPPALLCDQLRRREVLAAGVVHEHIQAPVAPEQRLYQPSRLGGLADVP